MTDACHSNLMKLFGLQLSEEVIKDELRVLTLKSTKLYAHRCPTRAMQTYTNPQ